MMMSQFVFFLTIYHQNTVPELYSVSWHSSLKEKTLHDLKFYNVFGSGFGSPINTSWEKL